MRQSEERELKRQQQRPKFKEGHQGLGEEGVVEARVVVEENRLEGGEESRLGRDCYR